MLSVGIESEAGTSEVLFRRGDQDGPFEVEKAKGIRRNDSNLSYNVDFLDGTIKGIEKEETFLHVLLQV